MSRSARRAAGAARGSMRVDEGRKPLWQHVGSPDGGRVCSRSNLGKQPLRPERHRTPRSAWRALQQQARRLSMRHLRELLADPQRPAAMTVEAAGLVADFSKQRVDEAAALITPPHWSDTRETEYQRQCGREDLLYLTRGVTLHDGISNERLKDRIGRPGFSQLQRLEAKLLDLRERALAREKEQWPRNFRYTGKSGRSMVEGRYLETGDVVSLTEAQATAWADRFEEVTEQVAEAVSSS